MKEDGQLANEKKKSEGIMRTQFTRIRNRIKDNNKIQKVNG